MISPGYIKIVWPGGSLDARLGDGVPTITEGYSKFETIARPKRSDVIEYTGKELFKLTIPCLFDGWLDRRSVEPDCDQLELLSVSRGGSGAPPQEITIQGPVPHSNLTWYIEKPDWGEAIYDGNTRLRQFFNLNLVQKLDMPYILKNRVGEQRQVGGGYRTVKVKSGDLRELAQTMLGDSRLWTRIINPKTGRKFRDWKVAKNTKVRVPR